MTSHEISMMAVFGVECSYVYREIGALETRIAERPRV